MSQVTSPADTLKRWKVQQVSKEVQVLEVQLAELQALRSTRAVYQETCGVLFKSSKHEAQKLAAEKLNKARTELSALRSTRAVYQETCGVLFKSSKHEAQKLAAAFRQVQGMVKGNKFKITEFLEKQISKAQSKPPAAVKAGPQQQLAADGSSRQQAKMKCVSPALESKPQQQLAQAGSKRSWPEDALTKNVDMPLAALQTAKTGKKHLSSRPHDSSAQPKVIVVGRSAKRQKRSKPAVPTILAAPDPQGKAVNSNWAAMKGTVTNKMSSRRQAKGNTAADRPAALKAPEQIGTRVGLTPVVALDCEMVGVGPDGIRSALARVCMVNNDGGLLLDQYVSPAEKVTDYRTFVSGIEPIHLKEGAVSLFEAQRQVAQILNGRVLVGHAVHHDLQALLLSHPRKMTRDTATYPPLMMSIGKGQKAKPRALRHLAETELGLSIQAGEHSPIDDARSALYLYHKHRKDWERHLQHGTLKDIIAPRLQKKIVMQQIREAAAAGLDADLIKDVSIGRRQQSFAKLAENDDMVDL